MVGVVHVISAVDVIDVDVVGVVPAIRPGFDKSEPKAVGLEARVSADQNRVAHVEHMLTAKMGTETVVRNSTAAPGT